jgi:serine/threonine-protein kinase
VAPPRIAEQLGRVLGGRYRLVAPLGTGASAHVYVADDVKLRRRVAVKVLHPALAQDETFLRRFRAEAQSAAALRHPHVLQVFDWGEDEDGPWLVLEYLSGGSLRDLLDRGHRLSQSQALLIGMQAAQGLEYAHRRGLVHRDIKPANLLFDDEGRLVIADFGLARALAEAAWTEPAGAILGTARYASPEQAKGSRVDGKADVYALALVLIESVTGNVPFSADTTIATLMARVDRAIDVPAELGPLAAALEPAGVPDPEARADAATLRKALDDVAGELPKPDPIPIVSTDVTDADATTLTRRVSDRDDLTILPPSTARGARDDAGANGNTRLYDDRAYVTEARLDEADPPARRWRRRILALVLTLAVLGGAGVAVAASGVAKPSHSVPNVANMTPAEARSAVADEKFRIAISRTEHHETVPAGAIISQTPREADELKEGESIRVVVSDGPQPREVPDLTGKTVDEAKALLAPRQLTYAEGEAVYHETIEKDRIVSWEPTGEAPRDTTVTVVLSKGKEPKPIPSLTDRTIEAVESLLRGLGFNVGRDEAYSDEVEKGQVISTAPPPGTEVQPGEEVKIIVSKGPETVEVPNLRGLTEQEAEERLRAAGLRLGDRFGPPNRRVFDSSPAAGSQAKRGSSVDIYTR